MLVPNFKSESITVLDRWCFRLRVSNLTLTMRMWLLFLSGKGNGMGMDRLTPKGSFGGYPILQINLNQSFLTCPDIVESDHFLDIYRIIQTFLLRLIP